MTMGSLGISSIVAFACLAAYVSGVQSGFLWSKDKEIDFKGLDKFLEGRLKDVEDPEANFKLLKSELDGQLTGGVKKAAEMLLELSQVNPEKQCDEDLVMVLRWASTGKLTAAPKGNESKLGRSNKLVLAQLRTAADVCSHYIEQTFNKNLQTMEASPAEWAKSKQVIDQVAPKTVGRLSRWFLMPWSCHLADHLAQLARNANDARKSEIFKDKKVLVSAYETYLKEPCAPILSNFKELSNGAQAIVSLRRKEQGIFGEPRLAQFRRVVFATEVCQEIVNISEDRLSSVYLCRDSI